MYKRIVILSVFLLGLYFICQSNNIETFSDASDNPSGSSPKSKMTDNCPDVLIQKGSALFLYNSKRANVPGVNPIRFSNLEEYIEFTEWQRSQGILCPILYLQHAYNAQGEPVYKARPSPTNLQGGLPDYYINQPILGNMTATNPNIIPPPTSVPVLGFGGDVSGIISNGGGAIFADAPSDSTINYQAFNTLCLNQIDTPLDNLYNGTTNKVSPNPMDTNWGGIDYTEKLVQAGYYKGDEVSAIAV